MKYAFRFGWVAALIVALFFLGRANACPQCNIFNYLADSVQSSKNIFKGRVIRQIDEQTAEVEIVKVLRGEHQVGNRVRFKLADAKEDLGKEFIFSDPTAWPPTFEILPTEFEDEILFLLQEEPSVSGLGEAIKRVQGVSVTSQELGMTYLVNHHDEAVGPLLVELNCLMPRVFSEDEVFFGEHRLGMLLKALFSNESDSARDFALSYVDELPKQKSQKINFAAIPSNPTSRGVFLRDLLTYSQQHKVLLDTLRSRLATVCAGVSGSTKADISYALLVSGIIEPEEILKSVGGNSADDMVALGLFYAGNYESSWWQHKKAYACWDKGLALAQGKRLRRTIAKKIKDSEFFAKREPAQSGSTPREAAQKVVEPKR